MSETLSGVTQLKIRDICLCIYMFGHMYVILYFDRHVFIFARRSTSSHTPLNRIFWFIDLYLYHSKN